MSQDNNNAVPQDSLDRNDDLVREIKQLAMGLERNTEGSDRAETNFSNQGSTRPQDWISNLGNYSAGTYSQPKTQPVSSQDKQVSDAEHRALIEKIKSEFKKPPLNPNSTLPTVTSSSTTTVSTTTYQPTTTHQPTTNPVSFTKDLDNLHSKVDEILRRTPLAQKRDREANELYSSTIGAPVGERRNSASSAQNSQIFTVSFNPNANLAQALAQPKTEYQPKSDYTTTANFGEASSTFATPNKNDNLNFQVSNSTKEQNQPTNTTHQSGSLASSTVFNTLPTSANYVPQISTSFAPQTNTYVPQSIANPTTQFTKFGTLPSSSTSNSQFLGNINPYNNPYNNPYSVYSFQTPLNSAQSNQNTGSLPRDRPFAFDKDKLDQIIKGIQTRGVSGPLNTQSSHNTSQHGIEKERSEKGGDLKSSHAGSEFGEWRKNNLRSGPEFHSDAPFPTFTEDYRIQGSGAPTHNYFDKASPKFQFETYDNRRIYTQHPQYDVKRGSHSERQDLDSQPQSKRDSVTVGKPNANDFFKNLEQGRAVIKMVSKEKTARQEEFNYNCGELENDDDSIILGFLDTKLKSIAQEDPYFCGNLEADDDDDQQKAYTDNAVSGGSKKRNSRAGLEEKKQGGLKESGIVDYEEFARGLSKNDSKKQSQKFLDDDDDNFVDFDDQRNRGGEPPRNPGHRRSDNMDSDKYVQKTEQIKNEKKRF